MNRMMRKLLKKALQNPKVKMAVLEKLKTQVEHDCDTRLEAVMKYNTIEELIQDEDEFLKIIQETGALNKIGK